jgi:hypothetical protein
MLFQKYKFIFEMHLLIYNSVSYTRKLLEKAHPFFP